MHPVKFMSHQVCKRCILPGSYPRITFDDQGICSICREYEEWEKTWLSSLNGQKKILNELCSKAKKQNKDFDALIPYSGGKDSSYVLWYATKKLGLNVLAYTFDNGFLSDYAKTNINNACERLGIEHVYYRLNAELMNNLFKVFVQKTGYPCTACMRAIGLGIIKFSELYEIPLIITGTSLRTELPLSREMAEHGHNLSYIKNVLKHETLGVNYNRLFYDSSFKRKIGYFLFNIFGRKKLINFAWINLADYIDWNYEQIFKTIKRELKWAAPENDEHMDCLIHPIQNYIQIRRFPDLDLDKLRYARLIMAGQITRADALHKLELSENRCSKETLNLFLKKIGLTKQEFDDYIDMGPRHLNFRSLTFTEKIANRFFHRRHAGNY